MVTVGNCLCLAMVGGCYPCGAIPDLPPTGVYAINNPGDMPINVESVVVTSADDGNEITITWIDDAGEEQWVTYRIIER